MNALQRQAWWSLSWTLAACAAVAIAWPWLGVPCDGVFFGLLGFTGFAVLFVRRPGYRAQL